MNELNAYLMNFLLLCLCLLIGYCLINFYDNEEYFKKSKKNITLKNILFGGNNKKIKNARGGIRREGFVPVDNKRDRLAKLPELKLFYAEWCGHCRRFKKEKGVWEKLKKNSKYKNKLKFTEIDCEENKTAALQNDIEGFPTLILFTKENKIVYNGDRTQKDILNFLRKHINFSGGSKKTLIR